MAAPITKLRIGLKPDTPEEHTRLLINVNTEAAQTALQISTDLRVRANPATAKIYYYNFDGSELLYTETIDPGGNGSWNGEPGRASTAQYEFAFIGWSTVPDQTEADPEATAEVYSTRNVFSAYMQMDRLGFITIRQTNPIRPMSLKTNNLTKNWDGKIFWSTDRSTWIEWDGTEIFAQQAGPVQEIFLKGEGNTVVSGSMNGRFVIPNDIRTEVIGDIRFLLDSAAVLQGDDPIMAANAFSCLFYAAPISTAPSLPSLNLSDHCYYSMFYHTLISKAPDLPATVLSDYCYQMMFYLCEKLEEAPALPATTLAQYCYERMFINTPIVQAPELPATNLADYCYSGMFQGCVNLVNAPELPATTLANSCYSAMFSGCSNLRNAPELPATTLANNCYSAMFSGCSNLRNAPELPATTLANKCYSEMFKDCIGIHEIPTFPAIVYPTRSCERMFLNCTNLKLSETQTTEYSREFRIPETGTGSTSGSKNFDNMFAGTGGTFTGTPTINKIYYLAPPASA